MPSTTLRAAKRFKTLSITPNVLVADKADDFIAPEDSDIVPDENEKPEPLKNQPDEQLRRAIEQLTKQEQKAAAAGASTRLVPLDSAPA